MGFKLSTNFTKKHEFLFSRIVPAGQAGFFVLIGVITPQADRFVDEFFLCYFVKKVCLSTLFFVRFFLSTNYTKGHEFFIYTNWPAGQAGFFVLIGVIRG